MSEKVTVETFWNAQRLAARIDFSRFTFWQRMTLILVIVRRGTATIAGSAVRATRVEGRTPGEPIDPI